MAPARKNQLTTWAKLKGTITETYQIPDVDKTLTASAFETEFAPTFNLDVQESQGGQMRRQPRFVGPSPTSPTQLTRRVREAPAQQ